FSRETNASSTRRFVRFAERRLASLLSFCLFTTTSASIITLAARSFWLADLIANLRVQLVLGLLLTMALSIGLRRWRWLCLTSLLLCWQASWLFPAFVTGDVPAAERGTVSRLPVCTVNVLTSNRQHAAIIRQLRSCDADVVAVLELSNDLAERINGELSDQYPHRHLLPQDDGNFGIGLLSRTPLTAIETVSFSQWHLLSIDAEIQTGAQAVRVIATHPIPPMSRDNFHDRNRHLNLLREYAATSAQEGHPVIIVGDLNLTPWSPVFRDWCRKFELQDASAASGLTPTWYRYPLFPFGLMLDHGLCTGGLDGRRVAVLDDMGSDHRAVMFEFHATNQRIR
ncbi:MAG: endonuclease/exonuclease/phosphatase family protein, partial [Planctomycetaceae bacterium]|nr:endonuclease/exonuclease/phosphatase family protein [Planctomycetaceae bacterium]